MGKYLFPKGEKHPNWKGGPSYCIDCKKRLSRRNYIRCRVCNEKLRGCFFRPTWKGKEHPFFGKHPSEETRKKISFNNYMKGRKLSQGEKHIISEASKKHWENPTYRKKVLGYREMSSLETKVQTTINKYNLPYKFVGNGKFYIERKCPDFINTNGKKIALEVYSRSHKEEFRGGIEKWKNDRKKIFNNYGWTIIFIEDWQTNKDSYLLNLLKGSDNGTPNVHSS